MNTEGQTSLIEVNILGDREVMMGWGKKKTNSFLRIQNGFLRIVLTVFQDGVEEIF